MSNIDSRRDEAKSHAKQNDHEGARRIWADLWARDDRDLWDARGLAQALRKLGRIEESIQVCDQALAVDGTFQPVLGILSWNLRDLHIKPAIDAAEREIRDDVVERILALRESTPDPYDPFAGFTACLLDIAKADLKSESPSRVDRAVDLLRRLDPSKLDPASGSVDGRSLPGYRQRWYSSMTKALELGESWQGVIDQVDQALRDSDVVWISNGDSWLVYRRAKARAELNRFSESVDDLRSVVARLDEWYVHDLLAHCTWQSGDPAGALPIAVRAARAAVSSRRDVEFKVNLFKRVGMLLLELGRADQSRPMLMLTAAIRAEQEWPADNELPSLLRSAGVELDDRTPLDPARHEVERVLTTLEAEIDPPLMGEVTKLLPQGKSGFILDEQGSSRYFSAKDCLFHESELREGLPVRFRPSTSFDRKKGQDSPSATDIRRDDR